MGNNRDLSTDKPVPSISQAYAAQHAGDAQTAPAEPSIEAQNEAAINAKPDLVREDFIKSRNLTQTTLSKAE